MNEPWPLQVGDIVEDYRPKSVFAPDPNHTYDGATGTVFDVNADGFKVRWHGYDHNGGYTGVRYAWEWLGQGMLKGEAHVPTA